MPFNHLIRGTIPVLLALAGAVALAVAVMPGAALATSTCTGVEVGRATWITTDSSGNKWLHTQITYRQPSGIECSVWLVEAYTGGSGGSDPTTNQLTTTVPGTPPPDTPPWQDTNPNDSPKVAQAKKELQGRQRDLARYQDDLRSHTSEYQRLAAKITSDTQYANDKGDYIRKQFGIDPNNDKEFQNKMNSFAANGDTQAAIDLSMANYDYNTAQHDIKSGKLALDVTGDDVKQDLKNIASATSDVAAAKEKLAKLQQQQAGQQVKAGPPPDLEPRDWMSHVKWWSTGSLSRFDDNNPANTIDGVSAQAMIGGDIILQPRLAIGFGIGTNTASNTTAAGTSSAAGLDLQARGFWGLNDRFWFDATLSYGYSGVSENNGGVTDGFDFHRFGFGAGANFSQPLAPRWRFNGRLGWAGSLSRRAASTDSGGTAQPATNGNFGQARADARFAYLFDRGEVFADGALRLVTNDSTGSADRFDGQLGGGVRFNFGNGMTLSGRGYATVGRDAYQEYGALVQLTGAF